MFTKETVYEIYAYYAREGFNTLWLCKTKETAEYLLAWEEAAQYNWWKDANAIVGTWSWEKYKLDHGAEFKIKEVEVYE